MTVKRDEGESVYPEITKLGHGRGRAHSQALGFVGQFGLFRRYGPSLLLKKPHKGLPVTVLKWRADTGFSVVSDDGGPAGDQLFIFLYCDEGI